MAQPTYEITAVPNRPTFASTAEMVQPGVFEVEYGFEAAKNHQNINGLLKWGAVKNLELWFLNNPSSGMPVPRASEIPGGIQIQIISAERLSADSCSSLCGNNPDGAARSRCRFHGPSGRSPGEQGFRQAPL